MSLKFEFATATRIIFGAGTLKQIGDEVKSFGRRALVVTGGDGRRAEKLMASLAKAGFICPPPIPALRS